MFQTRHDLFDRARVGARDDEDHGDPMRGLLYAVPISLTIWAIILWPLLGLL